MEGKIGKYQFDSELSLDDLSKTYVSPFPNTQNVENLNTFYIYDENYINLCRIKITVAAEPRCRKIDGVVCRRAPRNLSQNE